ncbi:MAG: hypothetical protein V3V08_17515 [Nannocystaceae bacterium]
MEYERHVDCAWLPAGPGQEQVQGEYSRLLALLDRICASNFPARHGYLTLREPLEGRGLRMRVLHDDFCGQVEVRVEDGASPAGSGQLAIQMRTSAGSRHLEQVAHAGARWLGICRPAGAFLGGTVLVGGAALLLGGGDTLFAAAFFLLLCAVLPVAGWGLGAWLGERVVSGTEDRAVGRTCADRVLQRDLRRWRAVSRLLLSRQRRLMTAGRRQLPFRR